MEYLSVAEVADQLGVRRRTVVQWLRRLEVAGAKQQYDQASHRWRWYVPSSAIEQLRNRYRGRSGERRRAD
jgi:transposase